MCNGMGRPELSQDGVQNYIFRENGKKFRMPYKQGATSAMTNLSPYQPKR
jgi:hypothetical protein